MRADEVYNATGDHKYGKRDWTVRQGLPPAGPVTIVEAMGRSTNDFFWEIAVRPQTGGIEGIALVPQVWLWRRPPASRWAKTEMGASFPTRQWKRRCYRSLGTRRRRWTW